MQPSPFRSSFTSLFRFIPLRLALALLTCGGVISTHAATRIWSGGHASSANWNLRDNWGGVAVPANGDTLVFPSGAARIVNTNNMAGLRLDSILFNGLGGGYNLRGNGVLLTNGLSATADAANTVNLQSLTLAQEQTFNVSAGGVLTVNSDVALNGFNLILLTFGDMTMAGAISGRGNLLKAGAGLLTFSGPDDNTYDGSFTVNGGTLAMNKRETISVVPLVFASRIAVPGALAVRGVSVPASARLNFDDQIANTATVTVMENGTLELNGNHEALDRLVLNGGAVTMGVGTLILNGNVTAHASTNTATISGQLFLNANSVFNVADGAPSIDLDVPANVGGAGFASLTKAGPGTLRLAGTNTYLGPTLINEGLLRVSNDSSLGAVNNGTTIAVGAELFIEPPVDTLREPLTIAGEGIGGTSGAIRIGSGATIATNIVLSAPATINTMGGGNLTISGVISGTGPLTKIGPGTLTLGGNGANTFSANLLAEDGTLLLSKLSGSAVQGNVVVGTTNSTATARHTRSANLSGAVTVNYGSLYDLNDNNESVDGLTMVGGGQVRTGTGLLTVQGDITVNPAIGLSFSVSTIDGRLHVDVGERHVIVGDTSGQLGGNVALMVEAQVAGSADIVKTGRGHLYLNSSNSFSGQLRIEDGDLLVSNDHALGTTAANTLLTGDARLGVSGDIVVNEPLFLNTAGQTNVDAIRSTGSNVWNGSVFLGQTARVGVHTNSTLNISGVINGLAGLTKLGPGTLVYSGTASNTYLGTTRVNEGTLRLARTGAAGLSIPGALIIGDGAGIDLVEIRGAFAQIDDYAPVTVEDSGWLVVETGEIIGSLSGAGHVHLFPGQGLGIGLNNASTTFNGVISGSGGLLKYGDGILTLTGTNTYTGGTTVGDGTLIVNGEQPSSGVIVLPAATLSGSGHVGNVAVHGRLAPGNPAGYLRTGNVNFNPGSTYAVEVHTGAWGDTHDWVIADGAVDLTGASLDLTLGSPPYAGQQSLILDKDTLGAITGTFAGLPEGAQIVVNQIPLRVSYAGTADGNDVVLTVGDLALRLAGTRVQAGNGNGRIDPDECNDLFVTLENPTGAAVNIVSAHLEPLNNSFVVTQSRGEYGAVPALGFRTNRMAFQIRSAPEYLCGLNARFHLVVQTSAHGRFAIPVTLPTGSPGAFVNFASPIAAQPIPEVGALSLQRQVTNEFRIGKVRVSLHASHPAAGDLRFRLVSPGGDEVVLAANRGGNAPNYGGNCSSRTFFDDDAPVKITAAAAPFAGTFAPEGNLSDFIGKLSQGTWSLLVEDTVAGDLGALQCWSLHLAPAECAEGGGGCESCLPAISGELDDSLTMPQALRSSSRISACGDAEPCPGAAIGPFAIGEGPYRYQTHTFTNTGPDTCATVFLTVPCGYPSGLMGSAYLGDFNPADVCAGFLGSSGYKVEDGSGGFSFRVPAGQRFTVVINEPHHLGQGCDNYSLELYGLPCPQAAPTLHIANDAGPDNVRLHWSTAYPGFQLQGTPNLGGVALFAFTNVANAPVVIGGNYSVTNNHSRTNNGFFRLRKP